MRVNVYAEEMTDRIEIIGKEIDGHTFTGLRFYLELPVTVADPLPRQVSGPFMHRPGDDDSAAVTFWGKRDLRVMLRHALAELDRHYGDGAEDAARVVGMRAEILLREVKAAIDGYLNDPSQPSLPTLLEWRQKIGQALNAPESPSQVPCRAHGRPHPEWHCGHPRCDAPPKMARLDTGPVYRGKCERSNLNGLHHTFKGRCAYCGEVPESPSKGSQRG
jgi:hypothetical protein